MARDAAISVAYVPFKTFLTALDTLRHGIPNPIDKSLFRNQSGTTQGMLLSSMRALKVIDENGKPEPILERLVDPASRKEALREIVQDRYASVLAIGPSASEKQFDDAIAAFGAAGDTKKKAKSFFLQAAHMADIQLSPHIVGARAATTGAGGEGAPRPPRRRRTQNNNNNNNGSSKGDKANSTLPPPPPPRTDEVLFHPAIDAFLRSARGITEGERWTQAARDGLIAAFTNQLDLFLPVSKATLPRKKVESPSDGAAES